MPRQTSLHDLVVCEVAPGNGFATVLGPGDGAITTCQPRANRQE